ncbi:reverse transcriptase domain-containing protein [Tanacetum coccineum]|uniref:Reverse transcriptase domain-containing protein n=1 Tax=Tanacetum coccineum TaxID=301880 RepID=A0ABQ5GRB0_9ASTR
MDTRSGSSTLRNEEICGNTANAYGTSTKRGSDDVPHSLDREHKCSFVRKKGRRLGGYEGEHDIVFQEMGNETPKDFLIEVPLEDNKKEAEEKADTKPTKMELSHEWKLFTDGAVSSDDSQLLVNQIKGTYTAKQPMIREYLQKTKEALKDFDSYTIEHIRRNQNKKARHIKQADFDDLRTSYQGSASRSPTEAVNRRERDPTESRKIRVKAPQYKLIRGNLYRRSFYTPWLCCVASPQTDDIVKEVHEASYGFNREPRSMVVRITKQGYYWPSMHRDAAKVLQDCEKCKEQSAIRKVAEGSMITARSG